MLPFTSTNHLWARLNDNRVLALSISLAFASLAAAIATNNVALAAMVVVVGLGMHVVSVGRLQSRSSSTISELTHRDALTGLHNRAGIEKWVSERKDLDPPLSALYYVDLDHFHLVNDTVGHSHGDRLLVSVARLLESTFSDCGTVARIAGDAFVVVTNCSPDLVIARGEKLLHTIRNQHFAVGDRTFRMTASIGVHLINADPRDFDALLAEADMARILAKRQGRDRLAVFDSVEVDHRDLRVMMRSASSILDRVANDELRLAVQRIESLSERGDTCEILLRTDGSAEGSPAALIQAAESFGLITTIDQWVVTATILAIEDGHLDEFHRVGINLSAVSINNDAFVDAIESLLRKYPAAAQRLCLELTETAIVMDPERVSQTMLRMKQCGVSFAIDDFGSGSASFALLRSLPFDTLKIDGQFVQRMRSDASDREVVKACVPVAQLRNMTTVAEWVEDDEVLDTLRDLSVDYVQGFAVARPRLLDVPSILARATECTFRGIDVRDYPEIHPGGKTINLSSTQNAA